MSHDYYYFRTESVVNRVHPISGQLVAWSCRYLIKCNQYSLCNHSIYTTCTQWPCPQAPPKSQGGAWCHLQNSHMCCVSSLRLEYRNHVCPLPITEFLTRESGRLVPRPFENENEASRLFVNLKFQKLRT